MNPLSHALSRNENNFGLVRLLAAIAVVYGYSYLLQQPDGSADWVQSALGFDGLIALGIYAFFLLSGMLVTASFDRQRSAPRFAVLRIARIWPAVAVGSLATVFVIGPLFTTLPLREYFASGVTWANLDNFSTLVLNGTWVVPGVFEHNRWLNEVSAPLWTLPLAVRCYLIVLFTGLVGLLSNRWGVVLAAALGLAAFVVRVHLVPHLHIELRDFSAKTPGYSFWPEPFFFIGMLLYGWREDIELHGLAALGLVMVFLVFRDTAAAQPLFYLAFVYGVLWIGTTPLLRRSTPRNDYSYGIYLYGFMMQQCVASLAPRLSHQTATLVAAPFILLCAVLSWRFVERPVLVWCHRRLARTPRAVGAAIADSAAR